MWSEPTLKELYEFVDSYAMPYSLIIIVRANCVARVEPCMFAPVCVGSSGCVCEYAHVCVCIGSLCMRVHVGYGSVYYAVHSRVRTARCFLTVVRMADVHITAYAWWCSW